MSHDGREYRVSLNTWAKKPAGYQMLKSEAQTLFRQWAASIIDRPGPSTTTGKALTVDALAARYIEAFVEHADRRPAAAREMRRLVLAACDTAITVSTGGTVRFGDLAAAHVTKTHLEALRHARRQATAASGREAAKGGRVAANRILSRLRHLFGWAVGEAGLLDASPFLRGGIPVVKMDTGAEGPRSRRLEGDEEQRLLAAAGPHLRACITMVLEAGMRRGEVLGMQWQHVKASLGLIELPATMTKTRITRVFAITPRMAAVLDMRAAEQRAARELPADAPLPGTAYVFGNELGERVQSIKTAWGQTCRRAGITGLTFHDLRRESGSRLQETPGVAVTDVRDFLGHRSVTQTNTYLASSMLRIRDALAKRDKTRTWLAQDESADEEGDPESPVKN